MKSKTTRIVLPQFHLTQICGAFDTGATHIDLPDGTSYSIRPKLLPNESARPDGKPLWAPRNFNVYPVVLTSDGTLWDEANVWILESLEGKLSFDMSTFRGKADDLQHYRNFIDDRGLNALEFPDNKLLRPTYRYRGFLRVEIDAKRIEWSTAKRRMSNVVQFYRWLINSKNWVPSNSPWVDKDVYLTSTDHVGRKFSIKAKSTDIHIHNTKAENPFDDHINDGGKLRPLSIQEQGWILDALSRLGNTEQALIQAMGLCTGARLQTVLTIRKQHVLANSESHDVLLQCGPGTGIDTKGNVLQTIVIPRWLYISLQSYAHSPRALRRRQKAPGGDIDSQFLFLSQRGVPMYDAKQRQNLNAGKKLRHEKNGQAVRAYMTDYIIPMVKVHHNPDFHYRYHDLRASFGMNLVDSLMPRIDAGELTYTRVLAIVQSRMNHRSPAVTERYLEYRNTRKLFESAQDAWEAKVQNTVTRMMGVQ